MGTILIQLQSSPSLTTHCLLISLNIIFQSDVLFPTNSSSIFSASVSPSSPAHHSLKPFVILTCSLDLLRSKHFPKYTYNLHFSKFTLSYISSSVFWNEQWQAFSEFILHIISQGTYLLTLFPDIRVVKKIKHYQTIFANFGCHLVLLISSLLYEPVSIHTILHHNKLSPWS